MRRFKKTFAVVTALALTLAFAGCEKEHGKRYSDGGQCHIRRCEYDKYGGSFGG